MKSNGKLSQRTPLGCVVQLVQVVLQFLDWILGLLKQQMPRPQLVQPPIEQPPSLRRRRAAFDAATAPFADAESGRLENMLVSQSRLLAEKRVDIRFSNYTGLVRTLRGELDPGRIAETPQDMAQIANDVLRQYEMALFGVEDNTWRRDDPQVIGSAARFRQIDQAGIPVYGGTVLCGFNNRGQMTIVTSSWHPLPKDTNYGNRFKVPEEKALETAREYVADGKVQGPPPPSLKYLDAVLDDRWQDGRVIFPWHDPETGRAEYRPGWAALVFDRSGWRSWKVMVDAEKDQVLAAAEARVGATLQAHVHLNNKQALDTANDPEDPQVSLKELRTVLDGDLSSLDGAPDFPMAGDVFANPPDTPPSLVPDDIQSKNFFRSANVYYHLHRAWGIFDDIVKDVWPEDASADPPTLPGSLDPEDPEKNKPLPVHMLNSQSGGYYNHAPLPINNQKPLPRIELGKGDDGYNPEIKDPTLDCGVVYHEYTHAVLHAVQPDIFDTFAGGYKFNSAINEGVAFYYGCTVSEERVEPGQPEAEDDCTQSSRWGEFAYRHERWARHRKLRRADSHNQSANHDYLQIYGVFPSYTNDPDPDPVDSGYACGMVWARALWDIRCLLGRNIADAIILRGLNLTGGAQSELETPAEAIIHADSEYDAGGLSHENALRLIFCSRGIMADTPIHDLISFELAGQTYLLAATESGAADPPSLGCLYSTDNGEHWAPLGTIPQGANGPTEVVALAAVEVKQNDVTTKVVIWAVSECWSVDGSNLTPRTEVYRYDLQANNPTTDAAWQYLEHVPYELNSISYKPNAFSLAAVKSNNANEFSLFVGTEIGLYRYYDNTDSSGSDSGWDNQGRPYLFGDKFFDLTITTEPAPRLLAVDDKPQLSIFNQPATGDLMNPTKTYPGIDDDYFLTVVADPDGKQAWLGTAFNGIYHFDLENETSNNWQPDGTTNRPVHSLEVEKFVEDQETKWRIYAGTNNGVYRCVYPLGQNGCTPFNQVSDPNGERIEGTSVVALCRTGNRLLAGTAQRSIWWRELDNSGWTRSIDGPVRIGRLVDARVPADAGHWSGSLTSDTNAPSLKGGGVGTHILYVPRDRNDALSFTVTEDESVDLANDVDLALHYVTPYTDLSKEYGAGLQARTLFESGETGGVTEKTMQGKVKAGYYVLAVKAKRDVSSYKVVGTLTRQG